MSQMPSTLQKPQQEVFSQPEGDLFSASPFSVALVSAQASGCLVGLQQDCATLLSELGQLLPWLLEGEVCAAQRTLTGYGVGLDDTEQSLFAVSRVLFLAAAYVQRAFPASPASGTLGSPWPMGLSALLPSTPPLHLARLEALVAQHHASLATLCRHREAFQQRLASMTPAALQASGLACCQALLAELQASHTLSIAMVTQQQGGGAAPAPAPGAALLAALQQAGGQPGAPTPMAAAGIVLPAGAAGGADTLLLGFALSSRGSRKLRLLRLTLQHPPTASAQQRTASSSSGSTPPLYLSLDIELLGRGAAGGHTPPCMVALTLPLAAQGARVLEACLVMV